MPTEFCVVSIELKGGTRHEFPDMPRDDVNKMLAFIRSDTSSLALVNIHGACLTMPMRVVSVIAVNGEISWRYLGSSSTPKS